MNAQQLSEKPPLGAKNLNRCWRREKLLASAWRVGRKTVAVRRRTSGVRYEQFDPNLGFYYLRARYLNPAIGRFLSMDAFQGINSDPITLHRYLYGNANPIKMPGC